MKVRIQKIVVALVFNSTDWWYCGDNLTQQYVCTGLTAMHEDKTGANECVSVCDDNDDLIEREREREKEKEGEKLKNKLMTENEINLIVESQK